MQPRFDRGDNVRIIATGKIGTVNEVLIRNDTVGYRVTVDGKVTPYQEKFLEAYIDEEQQIWDAIALEDYGNSNEFYIFQTWYRLKRPMEGNFYSYLGSRTIFNPYQFKPLAKFIAPGSEERLFIADEVGVGKTIETGIILTEMIARGRIDRRSPVLIVCPNSIGPKWVKEMRERFNLRFKLLDGKQLRNALLSVINTGYLPDEAMWSVVSLELIRAENYLNLLQQIDGSRQSVLWAMVIIDEAHHMRNVTKSSSIGQILSAASDMMLMLSATPLNLSDMDLFNQMTILNPALFPDIQTFNALLAPIKTINHCRRLLAENSSQIFGQILYDLEDLQQGTLGGAISKHPGIQTFIHRLEHGTSMSSNELASYDRLLSSLSPLDQSFTRTLKREAFEHRVTREVLKVPVVLSESEMRFYTETIQAIEDAFLNRGGDPAALGFVTNMPRRMLSSCLPAMHQYLNWCLETDQIMVNNENYMIELDDDSDVDYVPLPEELKVEFARLSEQAKYLGAFDTKYREFLKVVKQLHTNFDNPRILVFSFFVRTLKYLQEKLTADGLRVGLICGDIPVEGDGTTLGRFDIMKAFEDGEVDILLSSEVGGEGLDFQYCHSIINYDLPYNPMRVEQRIGRIDRFGQTAEKVIIASMYLAGTLDEDIYAALYERIKLVENSVGTMEPVLGNALLDLQKEIITGQLSKEQMDQRIKQLEITIAQARLEMEQFEEHRRELLGDDYFVKHIQNMGRENDFVKPSDAARLTSICLSNLEGCNYEPIDDHRGMISLSPMIIDKISAYTRRPGSEASIEELGSLLHATFPKAVIFNGSLADQYRDHCFLPPCGYWTRFLLSELDKNKNLHRVFRAKTIATGTYLPPGSYFIPIFETMLEGFRIEIDMNAVPINLHTKEIVECDYQGMSRRIFDYDLGPSIVSFSIEDSKPLIDQAYQKIEQQLDERMELLKAENQYRIDSRIESLLKGSQTRNERREQSIREHCQRANTSDQKPNQEFIRMIEAQISNDQARTQNKINSIRSNKNLAYTISLIAVLFLEIESN